MAAHKIVGRYCKTPGCKRLRYKIPDGSGRSAFCTTHKRKDLNWGAVRKTGGQLLLFGRSHVDNHGYRIIRFVGIDIAVHRIVDALTNGPIPKGWEVHHKDEVKLNNHWTNLQRMPEEEHKWLHAKLRYEQFLQKEKS